mgnify:CR=1 FL=1
MANFARVTANIKIDLSSSSYAWGYLTKKYY